MQIHRTPHMRGFTTLPNYLLQDRRLSYRARGVLGDLLSRPDGWREDGRTMADSCIEGRGAVAKALRELKAAGYYRVETIRKPDCSLISVSHAYDTPQPPLPGTKKAGSGRRTSGDADGQSKNQGKNQIPSLPCPEAGPASNDTDPSSPTGGVTAPPEPTPPPAPAKDVPPEVREAVATLFRVLRPEPRLRLGEREARSLAPLVAEWLARGSTEGDLTIALLPCLPVPLHSPVALLRDRLTRKLPPMPEAAPEITPERSAVPPECEDCGKPVCNPGLCRACAGLPAPPSRVAFALPAAARGAALARAALRGVSPVAVAAA
ncbi:hypothetical protein ABH940_002311 [Streptacidiphilus sp. BW17]|uniref:hypothetical protein n=1 Tax=Streptacidiphilus sp. BW17 TaxID=3156274 RepID=UPI0035199268